MIDDETLLQSLATRVEHLKRAVEAGGDAAQRAYALRLANVCFAFIADSFPNLAERISFGEHMAAVYRAVAMGQGVHVCREDAYPMLEESLGQGRSQLRCRRCGRVEPAENVPLRRE